MAAEHIDRSFHHVLESADLILTEGSIYERLRRHPGIDYDDQIAHAGLIYDPRTATILGDVHRQYIREATRVECPMVVSAGTWRANRERIARSRFANRDVNRDQVAFVRTICRAEGVASPLYVAGVLGPRGDAYQADVSLSPAAAYEFHAWQANALTDAGADLLLAMTLPAVAEARGLAQAMEATHLPYLLSFVVRADGTVLDGTPLGEAIDAIDQRSIRPPIGYAVNCVHPSVLDRALDAAGDRAVSRIVGYRANTSSLRPEELDGSAVLITQPASALAEEIRTVASKYGLKLLGGCCGTGTEHIAAIASRFANPLHGERKTEAIESPLGAAYLAATLRRAGRPLRDPADVVSIEPLLGGRTGAEVVRLRRRDTSYVVKTVPSANWRGAGTGCPDGGEPRLWLSGVTAFLPPQVRWPVLDVSLDATSNCYRMLMEDVGGGIRDRGRFTPTDSRELLRAVAHMHACCFEQEWVQRAPLPNVTGTVRVLAEPLLHAAGARFSGEPWVPEVLRDFIVLGALLPGFLDLLGPQMADAYLALVADDRWQARLGQSRATLLHGDLRRANIAFENGRVALLDWEFAAAGPPACDIQWHLFLHYWAYPPDGTRPDDDCDSLRDFYFRVFEEAIERRVDHAEFLEHWALGWIKTIATLGYLLYDPLHPNGGTPEARSAIRDLATRAVQRAIEAREKFGW
jgi:S-methylmethionine-dependent homocysteine/selenocysteine methylase